MSKDNKKSNKIYLVMALIFGIIFLCCIIWLISYFVGLKKAEKAMESIMSSYVTESQSSEAVASSESTEKSEESTDIESEPSESSEESSEPEESNPLYHEDLGEFGVTDRVIDFEALKKDVNKDIYSWIIVPGTVIDYPVLQHPTEMDYYLDHNLNGSTGYPGCIYTQRMNSKDWTDPNTVLYGHNMKNGTMFAALHKFKQQSFFEENPYIYIYTEDNKILVYKIFAAYEFTNQHLLMTYNLISETSIQSYFDMIRTLDGINNNFDNDIELTAESKVITLSTCISNKPDNRYLVQGVLVAEGEQK